MAQEVPHDLTVSALKVVPDSTNNNVPVMEVSGFTHLSGPTSIKKRVITVTGANGSDVARVLKENESSSVVVLDSAACGAGDNLQLSLPLAGDDATATTITTGLEFTFFVSVAPGDAGALTEISTGDDAVNMHIATVFKAAGADASVNTVNAAHSKLILTPATPAEALGTTIKCTAVTSTLWMVECLEPAAVASNLTSDAAAAFA